MSRLSTNAKKNHTASWWIVVAAGSLVIVFAVAMVREAVKSQQVRRQIKNLRLSVAAEEERHQRLDNLIAYLSSPTFQEREARLKLGLKKPGERVFVVPPTLVNGGQSGVSVLADGKDEADPASTMPQRWWRYFFPS